MRTLRFFAFGPLAAALLLAGPAALSVERQGTWVEWWHADRAPTRWDAALPALADAVAWQPAQPGVEWGSLRLAGSGEAWRIRVIVVRLDPALLRFRLHAQPGAAGAPYRWTVSEAPNDALLALNAGQFGMEGPWGWVVRGGAEHQAPGRGPLAPAVVIDQDGMLEIVPPDSIESVRASGRVADAFQSYPSILVKNGTVPEPVRTEGLGVDLRHRDSRLALGTLRDGRVLIALTRFEGLGGLLDNLPFGLTAPEMAAVMGALGAARAVLLDGGVSSQMLLREADGDNKAWRGMRYVPLGLVVTAAGPASR